MATDFSIVWHILPVDLKYMYIFDDYLLVAH